MRRRHRRRWLGALLALALPAALLLVTVERNIVPLVATLAEARAQSLGAQAMQQAVRANMTDPEAYALLVQVQRSEDGSVMMLQANTALINALCTRIALQTQENLSAAGAQGVQIPLGSVLGGQLLSGRGPRITVRVLPVGTVETGFYTEFEQAGINQTRHKIIMTMTCTVRLVLPGNRSHAVQVQGQVPLSEAVLIGTVPQQYVHIDPAGRADGAE